MSKEVQEAKEQLNTIIETIRNVKQIDIEQKEKEYKNRKYASKKDDIYPIDIIQFKAIDTLLQELDKLQKQIELKDEYSKKIIYIGFDHDGYSKAESLKELIDELVGYAISSLKNEEVEE